MWRKRHRTRSKCCRQAYRGRTPFRVICHQLGLGSHVRSRKVRQFESLGLNPTELLKILQKEFILGKLSRKFYPVITASLWHPGNCLFHLLEGQKGQNIKCLPWSPWLAYCLVVRHHIDRLRPEYVNLQQRWMREECSSVARMWRMQHHPLRRHSRHKCAAGGVTSVWRKLLELANQICY